MFVKPTLFQPDDPGEKPRPRIVRHEGRAQAIPETGTEVPDTTYWWRRLRDGDVVEATPPGTKPPTKTKGEAS